jgi:uncharacterized membrane protein YfcA
VAALVALGLLVGFVSGLVGIGGGVLIVPFLYVFYSHPAFSGTPVAYELQPAIAHATSLFIIVPTAVTGTITYHRLKAVVWRAALPVAGFSTIAAVVGSRIAPLLRPEWLKLGFGIFLLLTAGNLAFGRRREAAGEVRVSFGATALTGTLVGLLSALLGVGGGIVAIPLLLRLMRVRVEHVAATSLAIVAVAAAAGAIAYLLGSPPAGLVPRGVVGYVHVTAAIPILLAAAFTVRWGARVNQALDARRLRWGFAVFFAVLAVQLLVQNVAALWA